MTRSALLVSSEQADRGFSLHPLAAALATTCAHVDHLILGVEPNEGPVRTAARGLNAERTTIDGARCTRLAVRLDRHGPGGPFGAWFSVAAVERWAGFPCPDLDAAARCADLIVLQSGFAAVMASRMRRLAPRAALVYAATESLAAAPAPIGPVLARRLPTMDGAVAIRPALRRELRQVVDPILRFTPEPDPATLAAAGLSPYAPGCHVAVVGGAALDGIAVEILAAAYPDLTFTLLGPIDGHVPSNVRCLGHLPVDAATACLLHADLALVAGAAPDESPAGIRLAEALALLGHVGVATVCPEAAVDHHPGRHGFDPGRSASLREAFAAALATLPGRTPGPAQKWPDLAARLMDMAATGRRQAVREAAHAG